MTCNSETILTQQDHQGDSTSSTVTGDNYKGDGYYSRSDGLHTIQYSIDGFLGNVAIQATLSTEPTDDDWFTVYDQDYLVNTTESNFANFTGNYVWIRAYISDWTDGTVNYIKLNH